MKKNFTLSCHAEEANQAWDVIVVGGGPAGCTAAVAAARDGAKTLLIEATGMLGGCGTAALVPSWCPFSDLEKIIYRGLAETVFNRSKAGLPHIAPDALDWVPIDPERLKRVYDELVVGAGVKVLFNTSLSAVMKDEDGGGCALVVSNKAGLSVYRAKAYVDASGDADLCAWAGVPFQKGDAEGQLMPATHCFVLSNVDDYAYRTLCHGKGALNGENPNSVIYKIIASGKYPLIKDSHTCNNLIGPGTVGFNSGHLWNVDNTDPESVSQAFFTGRELARQFRDALAEYCPEAFANAFLVMTAGTMGVRETRRIEGDYVLTMEDYIARRSFDDEICRNSYFIDVHRAQKEAATNAARAQKIEAGIVRYGKGESHGIPYRCLVPKGLRNVLVAGRTISCERIVQGSVRVMPVCLAMGEAAGMAASDAALHHGGDVRAVKVCDLRERLRAAGAYLP